MHINGLFSTFSHFAPGLRPVAGTAGLTKVKIGMQLARRVFESGIRVFP